MLFLLTIWERSTMTVSIDQILEQNILSFSVVAFGAILLYFGKLIQDIQVESSSTLGYYQKGIMFSITGVFTPLAIVYPIYKTNDFPIDFNILIIIQIIIPLVLLYFFKKYYNLAKEGKSKQYGNLGIELFSIVILGVSFFNFYSVSEFVYLLRNNNPGVIALVILSLLLTFISITVLAILYSYHTVSYPSVKIYIENNPVPIEGSLIKFDETIILVKNKKPIRINKDKVLYIEEN